MPILPALIAIGIQTFAVSQIGFWLGGALSERHRELAERVAGVALITLGVILAGERLL